MPKKREKTKTDKKTKIIDPPRSEGEKKKKGGGESWI